MSIGYKKLRNNLIAKLCIKGENNECRNDIIDENTASFRCSKATVLDIYNMYDETKKCETGYSLMYPDFVYTIGKTLLVNNYEQDPEIICAPGIHYFKSLEPAYYAYLLISIPYTGDYKTFKYNGVVAWHSKYYIDPKDSSQKSKVIHRSDCPASENKQN